MVTVFLVGSSVSARTGFLCSTYKGAGAGERCCNGSADITSAQGSPANGAHRAGGAHLAASHTAKPDRKAL